MIVRNEAHIVREVLDAVAPYIGSWVIVDTGSSDGTPGVIRDHLAGLGIAGELHQRPWRNFGVNRSEALSLALGHGDYVWVIDADDTVVGTPDFDGLDADVYLLRCAQGPGVTYWRRLLFRDGMPWRYEGVVVHEHAVCDDAQVEKRLGGDYYIDSRRSGARSLDPKKYERDRDLLLAEVDRNPDDARSVFYLAQSCFDLGDFGAARRWYARRAQMSGWDEETYCAMFQLAESMSRLGEPWLAVQDAYLRAWEFRPSRAERLHAVAYHYRGDARYQLGHMFAARATDIAFPEQDILFVAADVYTWRALDERAVCASWIGRQAEAFASCRRLLAGRHVPDEDRQRIAGNRDICVPAMVQLSETYPKELARTLTLGPSDADVTVSLVAGPDRAATEGTLDSFLNCCRDLQRVGRFLIVADGLATQDRAILSERYRFVEFLDAAPAEGHYRRLTHIRCAIAGRFWLHLDQGWRFFAPESLITRLLAVLSAQPDVLQVGVNLGDASTLTGASAPETLVRRAPDAGRYVLTDTTSYGPAMFDTARLDHAEGSGGVAQQTATLDEVLCIKNL